MVNIAAMKNKSIWITRKIFSRLSSLNLQKYYFECAMIFLNVMLRSSILYACETYYNLKETELRQIERMEESFLRQLFKTTKGCPISPDSMIHRFYKLQLENPKRGDWASACLENMKYLEINMSLEEIKTVSENRLKNILKKSINKKALEYLTDKQGSKGGEIKYSCLKMADYLMPNEVGLTISDQRDIFSVRNRMTPIPANFSSKKTEYICVCGETEDMRHIYVCQYWNNTNENVDCDLIFTDNMKQLKKVYNRFVQSYKNRENYITEKEENDKNEDIITHVIPNRDPLFSVIGHSNGNIT